MWVCVAYIALYLLSAKRMSMSRFPQLPCDKGSQKWIQKLINDQPEHLNSQIRAKLNLSKGEHIQWLSPLKNDEYSEYRDQEFINLLEVELKKKPLLDFWPQRGPQWDAFGKSTWGNLFLVEAKSHIGELISTMKAKDEDSTRTIHNSLQETKRFLGSNAKVDWSCGFYQYTNRLAHLYLLRQNRLPAYLLFVYFINDFEMKGPTSIHEWKGAIELLHSYLGIRRHKLKDFVTDIFIDIKQFQ
jgi:hypothetical protein